ncbi:VanZ family protein [Pelagibacterium limicola]|uniref:VanZ family protein n=1 Tax=Pelagibacterium limicola TaxID=2791022 RepID=UPI0018AF9084|nr:VanZ family protein [Pelagibacterium limicola]
MIRRILLIGSVILILVIVAASLVPGGWRPHTPLHTTFEHFVAYGLVTFWFTIVLARLSARVLAAAGLIGLSVAMEVAQVFIPQRGAALVDIYFSAAGVVSGLLAGLLVIGVFTLAKNLLVPANDVSR